MVSPFKSWSSVFPPGWADAFSWRLFDDDAGDDGSTLHPPFPPPTTLFFFSLFESWQILLLIFVLFCLFAVWTMKLYCLCVCVVSKLSGFFVCIVWSCFLFVVMFWILVFVFFILLKRKGHKKTDTAKTKNTKMQKRTIFSVSAVVFTRSVPIFRGGPKNATNCWKHYENSGFS